MRRPGIGLSVALGLLLFVVNVRSAPLAPSADPVASFIAAADSADDAALSLLVTDNPDLVGASVAKLLEGNVALARRVAALSGSGPAKQLVDVSQRWTKAQRAQRANAIALESQSSDARKAGDIDKAIKLLSDARTIYERIGDTHSVAVNLGTVGLTRFATGNWDLVIADYDKALVARRAVEDRILEGRTLNGLGTAWMQKGEWNKAADFFRQAIEVRTKTGDLTGLGTSLTYLGHVYNQTGRFVEARKQYEEALPIIQALNNPSQTIDLLSGIAFVNASMGKRDGARDAYIHAIQLAADNGITDKQIACLRSLADNDRMQGHYADALDHLSEAEALLSANPNAAEQAAMHLNRGLTYMGMGELDDARVDLVKSAELAQGLDDKTAAILAQNSIGYLYRELGAWDRALKAADQARELSEQAGNSLGYRDAMALKGEVQFRTGRFDDALASYQEALAQDQADGAEVPALVDEVAIQGVHAAKGETAAARTALRALAPRVHAAKNPQLERALLNTIAHSYERENPDSARYYYESALLHLENEGEQIGGAELQTGYLSGKNRYYFEEVARYYASQAMAQPAAAAEWSDRAFRTMERAKARGLLDLLRTSVSARSTKEEDAALDALYSLDPSQPDYADKRAALEKKYLDLRRARVDAAVAGMSPGRDAPASAVTTLADVAKVLPKKTVMFEFALGDSSSLLWVIDRDRRQMYALPARAEIESQVRRFRDTIAQAGKGDADMLASARSLYQTLLAPGQERLDKAQTIIVVPDGALFELPFDALIRGDAQPGVPISHQWFVARKWMTVYAPSATVYVRLRSSARAQKYARDLFAVGNPDFSGLVTTAADPLAPLPFAQEEVDAIGAKVKPDRRTILTGQAASEAAVKQELRTESPRVVHLATHGLVNATEPARSSVALAPGSGEDGFFHTLEIISTPTNSDLVVMSACESARGFVSRGEGVVGLSRAFLGAGAESVVASLWSVSDESTAELMRSFYDRMFGKKEPASRALRDARIALLDSEKFSHPFFWSPFVVTGTERSPW